MCDTYTEHVNVCKQLPDTKSVCRKGGDVCTTTINNANNVLLESQLHGQYSDGWPKIRQWQYEYKVWNMIKYIEIMKYFRICAE